MPFWSSEQAALELCVDEWDDYIPVAVEFNDFISEWLPEFAEDGTLVGINWNLELEGVEIDAVELADKLIESTKEAED